MLVRVPESILPPACRSEPYTGRPQKLAEGDGRSLPHRYNPSSAPCSPHGGAFKSGRNAGTRIAMTVATVTCIGVFLAELDLEVLLDD
jgi:hypothetical protein